MVKTYPLERTPADLLSVWHHVSALPSTQEERQAAPLLVSVVENRRLTTGKTAQRQVLYLGEINDSQQAAWRKTLEVFDEQRRRVSAN